MGSSGGAAWKISAQVRLCQNEEKWEELKFVFAEVKNSYGQVTWVTPSCLSRVRNVMVEYDIELVQLKWIVQIGADEVSKKLSTEFRPWF